MKFYILFILSSHLLTVYAGEIRGERDNSIGAMMYLKEGSQRENFKKIPDEDGYDKRKDKNRGDSEGSMRSLTKALNGKQKMNLTKEFCHSKGLLGKELLNCIKDDYPLLTSCINENPNADEIVYMDCLRTKDKLVIDDSKRDLTRKQFEDAKSSHKAPASSTTGR